MPRLPSRVSWRNTGYRYGVRNVKDELKTVAQTTKQICQNMTMSGLSHSGAYGKGSNWPKIEQSECHKNISTDENPSNMFESMSS